jgi:hypothetical protein
MGLYIAANSAMAEVPILGWAMDTLFPGHLMAANALQKDIAARFGPAEVEGEWRPWKSAGRKAAPADTVQGSPL